MELKKAIQTRMTVRALSDAKVSGQIIEEILQIARFAPSVHNIQPWYFIIIDEDMQKIWYILEQKSPEGAWNKIKNAQILVAVCLDIPDHVRDEKELEAYFQSVGAVIENVLLLAHEKNLGGCWLGGNTQKNEEQLKEYLNIPQSHRLVTLISFGYYDADCVAGKSKKDLKDMIFYNKYTEKKFK